ncbi:hypothetical protein VCV18_005506 [Metarhizium anisopliae]
MSEDASRPSFTSFWRKGKQKLRGKPSAAATPEGAAAAADPFPEVPALRGPHFMRMRVCVGGLV